MTTRLMWIAASMAMIVALGASVLLVRVIGDHPDDVAGLPSGPLTIGVELGPGLPALGIGPRHDVDPLLALRRATDLRGALESARRQLPADSPLLRSLREETRVACSIVRRPDASARRVESDPNRRIWIDHLLRRCAGLLDTDLAPPIPSAEALSQWNRQLPLVAASRTSLDAGVELARKHLVRSADPQLIAESLRFLHDEGRLPVAEIFQGLEPPSHGDIETALIFAADWIACERSDSCAADGLWTLYTCAQFGCPDGSDLPRALYRILPAQQYEIAQRMMRWATRQ